VAGTVQIITAHKIQNSKQLLNITKAAENGCDLRRFLKMSRLDAQRMSAGSALKARGQATETHIILERQSGMLFITVYFSILVFVCCVFFTVLRLCVINNK